MYRSKSQVASKNIGDAKVVNIGKMITIIFLIMLTSEFSYGVCSPDSQSVFCRLKQCVEGTHWESKKIVDPVQMIKGDGIFDFDLIILPMGHVADAFLFHAIQEGGSETYFFPKNKRLPLKCDEETVFSTISVKSKCSGDSLFGYNCWFKKPSVLRVQPYRVNYWDGRKVNFLCTRIIPEKSVNPEVKLTKKDIPEGRVAAIVGPILKARMKQLARAIKADEKNIDPKKIIAVAKRGGSPSELGACRYFLDGNTLNLVVEAINKRFPETKN